MKATIFRQDILHKNEEILNGKLHFLRSDITNFIRMHPFICNASRSSSGTIHVANLQENTHAEV